jgi:hypothetical protein
MSTKQQAAAENIKRREELAGSRQQISHSTDIDYPLTAPSKKAQSDRLNRDEKDVYAKPYPVESNLTARGNDAEPIPQSPEEFKETGGVKVSEGADIAEANSSGTDKPESTEVADTKTKSTKENKSNKG